MTVHKTDNELNPPAPKSGPDLVNMEDVDKATVTALKARWPNAKIIEQLPSGSFAVRFRRKKTVYERAKR